MLPPSKRQNPGWICYYGASKRYAPLGLVAAHEGPVACIAFGPEVIGNSQTLNQMRPLRKWRIAAVLCLAAAALASCYPGASGPGIATPAAIATPTGAASEPPASRTPGPGAPT